MRSDFLPAQGFSRYPRIANNFQDFQDVQAFLEITQDFQAVHGFAAQDPSPLYLSSHFGSRLLCRGPGLTSHPSSHAGQVRPGANRAHGDLLRTQPKAHPLLSEEPFGSGLLCRGAALSSHLSSHAGQVRSWAISGHGRSWATTGHGRSWAITAHGESHWGWPRADWLRIPLQGCCPQ